MHLYKIKKLNQNEYEVWNTFVEQSLEGTIFHRTDWLDLFGDFFILACYNQNDELIAGMPCFVKRKLFCNIIANPPLTPYQGIIFGNIEGKYVNQVSTRKKISSLMLSHLHKNYKNITINVSPQIVDIQPYVWQGFKSSVRYTYILNLDNLEEIENSMEKEMRTAIKKAVKDNLVVKQTDDFRLFFSLVKRTFERQDKTVSFEKDAAKIEEFLSKADKRRIFLVFKDNTPIGGVYIIFDSKRSYYLLGGYDSEKSHYGASALAIWTAIKYAKEKLNLSEFDFEGSMIPQVERFFRQFGGQLRSYYTVSKQTMLYRMMQVQKDMAKKLLLR